MDNIRQIALQVYQEQNQIKQFNVAQSAFHIHNQTDGTPNIPFSNISNRSLVIPYTLAGTEAATAANYSTFFTLPFNATLSNATEVHTTAGTDGSAVTLQLEKLIGTTAPGSGISLLTTAFNLKGTINTVQNGSFITTLGSVQFQPGDRIALLKSGTLTAVTNVTVTLVFAF